MSEKIGIRDIEVSKTAVLDTHTVLLRVTVSAKFYESPSCWGHNVHLYEKSERFTLSDIDNDKLYDFEMKAIAEAEEIKNDINNTVDVLKRNNWSIEWERDDC